MKINLIQLLTKIKSKAQEKYKNFSGIDLWSAITIIKIHNLSKIKKRSLGIKRTVRLVGNFPGLWARTIEQTPNGSCQFGKTLFIGSGDADYCLVLNKEPLNFKKPPSCRVVLGLHMEPEGYIKKFGYEKSQNSFITHFFTNSEDLIKKKGVYVPSPPYVHFHIGKSWDFLNTCRIPEKNIDIGVIVSDLIELPGHKKRLDFIEKLDKSGLNIAIWGRGKGLSRYKNYKGPIYSKWDAYKKCKYTVIIENTVSDLYWTEKVVDALLAYTLPFYYGSNLIHKYLPSKSIIPIDIMKDDAVKVIKSNIQENEYQKRLGFIIDARNKILYDQNLYSFIDKEISKIENKFYE